MRIYFLLLLFVSILFAADPIQVKWEQTNGPGGGYITGIAVDGENIYASSVQNGIYLSRNNGKSWNKIPNCPLLKGGVEAFTVNKGIILFGGGYDLYRAGSDRVEWIKTDYGIEHGVIKVLYCYKSAIFIGTSGGIARSIDAGKTWEVKSSGLKCKDIQSFSSLEDIIFVSTTNGIFKSVDLGENWIFTGIGIINPNCGYDAYIYDVYADNGKLYAGTYGKGIYTSGDLGDTWNPLNFGIEKEHIRKIFVRDNVIIAGSMYSNLYRSTDYGKSWVKLISEDSSYRIQELIEKNNLIFAATFGHGVLVSEDFGLTWSSANEGLSASRVIDMLKINDRIISVSNGLSNLSIKHGNCDKWEEINSKIIQNNIIDLEESRGVLYAAMFKEGISMSTDYGNNWKLLSNSIGFEDLRAIAIIDNSIFLAGFYKEGLFISKDNGNNWKKTDLNIENPGVASLYISQGRIYAGTNEKGIFFSDDKGENWIQIGDGLPKRLITSIVAKDSLIFASTHSGLFCYNTNDNKWSQRDEKANMSIEKMYLFGNDLYLANARGIYFSQDNGWTWSSLNGEMDAYFFGVHSLLIDDGYLYAGTALRGVWKAKITW